MKVVVLLSYSYEVPSKLLIVVMEDGMLVHWEAVPAKKYRLGEVAGSTPWEWKGKKLEGIKGRRVKSVIRSEVRCL